MMHARRGRKPSKSYDEWSAIVQKVETAKRQMQGATVDDACRSQNVERKLYNYARQMIRRGKPLAELGIG